MKNVVEFKVGRVSISPLVVTDSRFKGGDSVTILGRQYAVESDDQSRCLARVEIDGLPQDVLVRVIRVVARYEHGYASDDVVFQWPAQGATATTRSF